MRCSNVVCHSDPLTGEIFCPLSGGWVECCPKETQETEDDHDDDE